MKDTRLATIEDLPDPIVEYILSYLSPYKDLKQCMLVNKAWYQYVCDVVRKTQRDFYNAICNMSVQWCHILAEPGPTITKRYSHSACCDNNSMYIFGGCTTANTTFNDLWRLDLGTRYWIRPLATGTYPPPKACATLVNYFENLVLFGGWTHTSPYTHQPAWRVLNQVHVYNTRTNRWSQISCAPNCPALAGHSASVHGDSMVVFGGMRYCDGPFQCFSDVWTLDLKTFKWKHQTVSNERPDPRYGHSQIVIDKHHLLIMGGCGGPNKLFTDIWLLTMIENDAGEWQWKEMDIMSKENGAPHMAFHPACKVGSEVVVLSKMHKSHSSPSSLNALLRAPSRIWVPPRINNEHGRSSQQVPKPPDTDPCVNGKKGVLKRPSERCPRPSPLSSSDEEDSQLQVAAAKRKNLQDNITSHADSQPSTSSGAASSSSSTSAMPTLESRRNPNGGESSRSNSNTNGILPRHTHRNRQRQLEGLDRMEQRLKDLRAVSQRNSWISPNAAVKQTCTPTSKNPMCLYVLDISTALPSGYVSWRPLKNQSLSAPEEIMLYSLVLGKGELIMFGGIHKDLNLRQQEGEAVPEVVSNSLHFMTAERFVV